MLVKVKNMNGITVECHVKHFLDNQERLELVEGEEIVDKYAKENGIQVMTQKEKEKALADTTLSDAHKKAVKAKAPSAPKAND